MECVNKCLLVKLSSSLAIPATNGLHTYMQRPFMSLMHRQNSFAEPSEALQRRSSPDKLPLPPPLPILPKSKSHMLKISGKLRENTELTYLDKSSLALKSRAKSLLNGNLTLITGFSVHKNWFHAGGLLRFSQRLTLQSRLPEHSPQVACIHPQAANPIGKNVRDKGAGLYKKCIPPKRGGLQKESALDEELKQ